MNDNREAELKAEVERLREEGGAMTDLCLRCRHTQDAHGGDKDCMCGECMWFVSPSGAAESALTEARAEVEQEGCSSCGQPMDSQGCCKSPGREGAFHTVSGGVAKAAPSVQGDTGDAPPAEQEAGEVWE